MCNRIKGAPSLVRIVPCYTFLVKIYLPLDNFSFFKVVTGSFFLLAGLLFPLATYFSLIAAVFSRPHGLGAYFSMWRAGSLIGFLLLGSLLSASQYLFGVSS